MKFLKFIWNDSELFWKINNDKLQKGKLKDKKEIYNLSLEEENILDEILSKVLSFSKPTNLKNIYFNNKTFKHFVSEYGFNVFYEEKDNKLTLPSEKDLKILNFVYNNQEGVWAFQFKNSNNKDYFKRIVNVGKKAIIVSLISSITIGLNSNIVVRASAGDYEAYYQNNIAVNQQLDETENVTLTYEDVVNLINANPYLNQDEKNLILSCKQYFLDNLTYMDNAHVQKMLTNLQIEYRPESNGSIDGSYDDANYKIIIYHSTQFSNASKAVLTHEISHAFAISPLSYANTKCGQKVIEALNVIVNNEYYGENERYDGAYNTIVPYARILCEIVDRETLKQAFFKTDMSLIEDYLLTIINDKALVENLLVTIDANLNLESELFNSQLNETDQQNMLNLIHENSKIILDSLKLLYETKTQDSIVNNEEIMFWYNKNALLEKQINEYYSDAYLKEIALNNYTHVKENKTYFTNQCPNSIINLCTQIDSKYFLLNEEDIEQYKQEGIIKLVNGTYLISDDYQNQLIVKDNQFYFIGYSPSEYKEYKLQTNNLNYQR